MEEHSKSRIAMQVLIGAIAVICILPSAGINVMHQLAHTPGPLAAPLAAASVLSVCLAAASPFAAERAFMARNGALLVIAVITGTVCLGYNLSVAIGASSTTRAEITGNRQAEASRTELLNGQLVQAEKSRAALASISHEKTPGVLTAELSGLEQGKAWTTSKGCTDATLAASRAFCQDHAEKLAALDAARKVETLDSQIASLKAALLKSGHATGQPADVQATNIAAALAFVGLNAEASAVAIGLNLSLAVLVEIIGAFGPLVFAATFRQQHTDAPKRKAKPKPAIKQAGKGKGGRKATITREQALDILRKQAVKNNGRIVASGAALAASLGVSRSTVCDPKKGWLAHWVGTGDVVIEKRGVVRVKAA